MPDIQNSPGNLAVCVFRRYDGEHVTIWLAAVWTSRESVERCRSNGVCPSGEDMEVIYAATQ